MNDCLVKPFIDATANVFNSMLGCDVDRGEVSFDANLSPEYEISGIIGLAGRASGTVIVSLERSVALSITETFLGVRPEAIDENVIDAVGELANMISGSAKAAMPQYDLSISLPTVTVGQDHVIRFGSNAPAISIPFETKWGRFSVEVGLVESREHEILECSCSVPVSRL